ncbi:MAG: DUF5110 domain-containing protein, partial [Bacilli bacterium]|nr:DUF5110 domain-containing protein [Bacilli bacterium]
MANIDAQFNIDYKSAKSKDRAIFKGSKYRITILSDRLIRFEYDANGVFFDKPTEFARFRDFSVPDFQVEENDKTLVIQTKYCVIQYLKDRPFEGPKYAPDQNLKVGLLNSDKIWYFNHPEARNFGGTKSSLDRNIKDPLGRGLYSTDGFASFDDSRSLVFTEDGFLEKPSSKRIDTYLFIYRRDFGLCLKDYYTLMGYPPLIPRYALGIWWNKDVIYSFNDTKKLLKAFNNHKIPLSILLLNEFWHLKDKRDLNKFKTGFTFSLELFPDPYEFTSYLHERGVRLGLNIDPIEGINEHEEQFKTITSELGLMNVRNIPFNIFDKTFINIYFRYLIKPLDSLGVDFYWLDYKHDLDSLKALNYYHFINYYKDNRYRPMLFSRNSLVASHLNGVHYSGQTKVSFDTLNYLPSFNSSASNIGVSWWSHDIGGFKGGIEDAELYIRYVELGTFSPIFRFACERGHYYKRAPWEWDIKTYTIAKNYCEMRHRLIPYLYTENYKYHKTGLPLIQPLYYSYPELKDEPIYKNEYYFGSELLVKPITKKQDEAMNRCVEHIFLPKGVWYDFKTGKKFPGNKRYVAFYKDEDYPVFARSGSIIPLADLPENINDTNPPKSMEIHVFPGRSNIYKLYEDDGISRLNEEGYYIITAIDYNYLANNYTLIIRPIEGKAGIIPKTRDYKIRFRNTREAESVLAYINGTEIPIESYAEDTDFIVVAKNVPTTSQLTINCKGKDIEIDAVRLIN